MIPPAMLMMLRMESTMLSVSPELIAFSRLIFSAANCAAAIADAAIGAIVIGLADNDWTIERATLPAVATLFASPMPLFVRPTISEATPAASPTEVTVDIMNS
jgi:hypothetical protein